jgi:hypothetical protein
VKAAFKREVSGRGGETGRGKRRSGILHGESGTDSMALLAAPAASPLALAEGVARVVEKHICALHATAKDEVSVVPLLHPSLPAAPPALADLPPEISDALRTAVQRETNRAALRSVYRQRMATFKENLGRLDPDVAAALRDMHRTELTVTAPGVQITLKARQGGEAAEAGGGAGASQGDAAAAAAPLARSKPQLRQGMVYAAASAIADLGVDPAQAYDEHLAARLLSHPQLRPLILVKLPEAMAQAAEEHAEALREGRISKPGRKRSAAPPPSVRAVVRGSVEAGAGGAAT